MIKSEFTYQQNQTTSPVRQSSNHNQFIGYAKMHQNKQKPLTPEQNIPYTYKSKNLLDQRYSERSGSDYMNYNGNIKSQQLKRVSQTYVNIPKGSYQIQNNLKLVSKTHDSTLNSQQLLNKFKKSSTPQGKPNTYSNLTNNTQSKIQREFVVQTLCKSQSQPKATLLLTEPNSQDKKDILSVKSSYLSKQSTYRPPSTDTTNPILKYSQLSYKNDQQRQIQNVKVINSPKNEQQNIQLSLLQLKQKLNIHDSKSYLSNSHIQIPMTTRQLDKSNQIYDNQPQTTKNNIINSSKSFQFQQQLTSHLQKLNNQYQQQQISRPIQATPKQIIRQDSSKKLNEQILNLSIKAPSSNLNQFVTQVKMGSMNAPNGDAQVHLQSQKKSQTQSPQQFLLEIKKGIENFRQNDLKTSDFVKRPPQTTARSITYYMAKMIQFQNEQSVSQFCQIYRDHFAQSYHALGFCKMLQPSQPAVVKQKTVFLSRRPTLFNKTIVLDLDETLIHCNESTQMPADVYLPIEFPNGEIIQAGVNVRPYAEYLLTQLTSLCEIIVFTASHSCYAQKVINHLDPTGKLVHHRLFRDSCVTTDEGVHIKDLSIFGDRDLKDLVLVDNAAYSYGRQIDNGIPIIPFYDNKKDTELLDLLDYVKSLLQVHDVREVNHNHFKMHMYAQYDTIEKALSNIIVIQ